MEVTAKLEFTRPCLGNVRHPDVDRMERDPEGNVIFLPTWWRSALAKAAQAINKHHKLVDNIRPALQIYGPVTEIERRYIEQHGDSKVPRTKVHEGFDVGAVVECSFMLMSGMTANHFTELLEAVGTYFGFSPYGWRLGLYGFFKVLEVRKGGHRSREESGEPPSSGT